MNELCFTNDRRDSRKFEGFGFMIVWFKVIKECQAGHISKSL